MWEKCNTSGGLRALCGSVGRESVGPFCANRVSAAKRAWLWKKRGVEDPSSTEFFVRKVRKIKGLGESSGGSPRFGRNLRTLTAWSELVRVRRKYDISSTYGFSTLYPPDVGGSFLVWGWEQFVGKEEGENNQGYCVNNQYTSDCSASHVEAY